MIMVFLFLFGVFFLLNAAMCQLQGSSEGEQNGKRHKSSLFVCFLAKDIVSVKARIRCPSWSQVTQEWCLSCYFSALWKTAHTFGFSLGPASQTPWLLLSPLVLLLPPVYGYIPWVWDFNTLLPTM